MLISFICSKQCSILSAISVAAEFRCRGDELLGEYADEIRARWR